MTRRICFRPIGWVYNAVSGARYEDWDDVVSEIVLDEDLEEALEGIEEYSHITVLFYLAGVTGRERRIRRLHPRDRQDVPLVGVFATRSQYRPNPIGMTVARLLERHGNRLRVSGLDAYNETPVLDIKPYIPDGDLAATARVPDWLHRLQAPEHRRKS